MPAPRILLLCLPALTACSGSGGSGEEINALLAEGNALFAIYGELAPTPEHDPALQTGTAAYQGIAGFAWEEGHTARTVFAAADSVSRVQLTANFDESTLRGRFYDFQPIEGNDAFLSGRVTLEAGIVGHAIEGILQGEMIDVARRRYEMGGLITGHFVGAGANAMVVDMLPRLDGIETSGGFVAARR